MALGDAQRQYLYEQLVFTDAKTISWTIGMFIALLHPETGKEVLNGSSPISSGHDVNIAMRKETFIVVILAGLALSWLAAYWYVDRSESSGFEPSGIGAGSTEYANKEIQSRMDARFVSTTLSHPHSVGVEDGFPL